MLVLRVVTMRLCFFYINRNKFKLRLWKIQGEAICLFHNLMSPKRPPGISFPSHHGPSRCVHHIHPSLLWDACHEYDSYHGYSTFRDETGAKSMEPDQRGVGTWMKRCATSLRESSTSALRPSLSWIPRDIGPGALPHLSGVCFMSRQACCSIMKQNLAYSSRDFKT